MHPHRNTRRPPHLSTDQGEMLLALRIAGERYHAEVPKPGWKLRHSHHMDVIDVGLVRTDLWPPLGDCRARLDHLLFLFVNCSATLSLGMFRISSCTVSQCSR